MTLARLEPDETGLAPAGRDARGRFAAGNPGGPGRPPRQTELDYLLATQAACTPEEWGLIVLRAKADALGGCPMARAFLARYLIGRDAPRMPVSDAEAASGLTPEALLAVGEGMMMQVVAEQVLERLHGPEWRAWVQMEAARLGLRP